MMDTAVVQIVFIESKEKRLAAFLAASEQASLFAQGGTPPIVFLYMAT